MRIKIILAIAILFLFTGQSFGATKTVCASGCDYTTIAAAEAGATASDTINVSTGTYNESNPTFLKALTWVAVDGNGTVTVTNSGAATATTKFAGNGNAISITGFVFDALDAKDNAVSFLANAQNKTLTSCTFQNSNGTTLHYATGHSNINIINSTINEPDQATDYVVIDGSPVGTISGSTFNIYAGNYCFPLGNSTNLTFTNNTVTVNAAGTIWDLNGTNMTLTTSGNTIDFTGTGYYVNGTRASKSGTISMRDTVTIKSASSNNPYSFSTAAGWTIDLSHNTITATAEAFAKEVISISDQINPLIHGNIITLTAQGATRATVPIAIRSTGTDCTNGGAVPSVRITDNTIYSNAKTGYCIMVGTEGTAAGDSKINNAVITGNNIYGYYYYNPAETDGTTHGIFVGFNINPTIKNNYENGTPYAIAIKSNSLTYTSGGVINNLFVNCNYITVRIKGVSGVNIYNNTIYSSNTSAPSIYVGENTVGGGEATGIIIKNNILYSNVVNMISVDDGGLTDFSSDNNLFYSTAGSPTFSKDGGSTNISLSTWQGDGYDTHSVNSNPLLTADYRLKTGSPAINAGVDVGLTTDFTGGKLAGKPDIGVYERRGKFF